MRTLQERVDEKKKSLFIQSILILFLGIVLGMQYYRVAINYSKVDINNIQVVLNEMLNNINKNFIFIPTADYLKVPIIAAVVAFCYYVIRSNNIKKYMPEDGYGSSRWAKKSEISRLAEKDKNILLAKDVKLSINTRYTNINDNILVLGTAGSGKTRFYIKPNLMESALKGVFEGIIVTDPKGELIIETANMMKRNGYKIKVFDIKNWKGNHWNPFVYFDKDVDILSFVNSLIENTNKGQKGADPFWDNASILLFNAVFFYLKENCNLEERNLLNVKRLIKLAAVNEDDDSYKSTLDIMMENLEKEKPESKAVEYYKEFKKGAGKTLKSIIITCLSRLNFIGLDEVDKMLSSDDMEIQNIGYEKTVLYIIIPDDDNSFNFLSSMFVDQLFRVLIRKADNLRRKPYIHFFLDEFANIGKLNYFPEKISTIRSRNISATLVVQNIQQIENLYKGQDKIILENCNTKLVLATSECAKWVSEKLQKMTIDNKTTGRSKGKGSSSSSNESKMSRALLTPDEVERLDKDKCIILMQSNFPILAQKYDIKSHKLYKQLGDVNEENRNNYEVQIEYPHEEELMRKAILTFEEKESINEEKAALEMLNELRDELDGELDGLSVEDDYVDDDILNVIRK